MGGKRETVVQSKSEGSKIGSLRIHENAGFVHFHDDNRGLKVAVPVAEMYSAWGRLTSGKIKKFKYTDMANGSRLNMRVFTAGGITDIEMSVKRTKLKTKSRTVGLQKTADFDKFNVFINGQ